MKGRKRKISHAAGLSVLIHAYIRCLRINNVCDVNFAEPRKLIVITS